MKGIKSDKNLILITFLFIPVLLMLAFVVYPAIEMFRYSLTNWDGASRTYDYIGLKNYAKVLFESKEVWQSFRNNMIYLVISFLFIPIEILFAVFLNSKIRGSNLFKSVYFLPYIINGVAISYVFSFFFSSVNGGLNGILELLGLENWIQNWVSNKDIVNYSLSAVYIWRNFGFFIVLFLSGLQTIPSEILEAAVVDGANSVQRFRYIVLPEIKRVIQIVVFMNITWCLQIFDIPFVMTSGGPGNASSTFSTYTIKTAFTFNNFGLANAMAVVLMCIIVVLLLLQSSLFKVED